MIKKNMVVNMLVYDELIKKGKKQYEFLKEIQAFGITKVEIRKEWVADQEELVHTKKIAEELQLELFYSIPDLLYSGSMLAKEKIEIYLEEAYLLGAKQVKMTAGFFEQVKEAEVDTLNDLIKKYSIHNFTIENDQNKAYSTGEKTKKLVEELKKRGANISLTFDTGNWLYVDENPLVNTELLNKYVTYIHLKDVQGSTLKTTLLGEGDVPWERVLDQLSGHINLAIEYPCGLEPKKVLEKEIKKILKRR